jgi:hypothetical protein
MSSNTVAIYVHARDPISQAGVAAQLRMRPEIRVVDTRAEAAVAVMIVDTVDESTTRELRAMHNSAGSLSRSVGCSVRSSRPGGLPSLA